MHVAGVLQLAHHLRVFLGHLVVVFLQLPVLFVEGVEFLLQLHDTLVAVLAFVLSVFLHG